MSWKKSNSNPNEYTSTIPVNKTSYTVTMNLETGTRTIRDNSGSVVLSTPLNGASTQGPAFSANQNSISAINQAANTATTSLINANGTAQQKQKLGASGTNYNSGVGNAANSPEVSAGASTSGTSAAASNQTLTTAENAQSSVERNVGNESGGDLRYPLKNTYQGDYIHIEMRTYQKSGFQSEPGSLTVTRMEDRKHSPLRNIYLPIQSGIVDSISVDWGNGELNPLTAQFANLAMGTIVESGRSNPGQAAEKFVNNFGAIADKVLNTGGADMQKLVANYYTERAVGTPGLMSRSIGGAINNNLELLFNGPTLRSFTFNFKLTPREKKEAEVIKEIIRVLKKGMSPALSKSGLFLSSPNVFKIKYFYTGKGGAGEPHPYLNRIKVAALRDFSVNYTPDGNYMTYADGGSMTQYDLSMTFGEIDPVYAQDYDEEQGSTGMGW